MSITHSLASVAAGYLTVEGLLNIAERGLIGLPVLLLGVAMIISTFHDIFVARKRERDG